MYAQIYKKINNNNKVFTQQYVSLSAEEIKFLIENIQPNEKKLFEKNIFSSFFNVYNIKKEDITLSTIDILIKYRVYPVLGTFLRKINSNGFSKMISKMIFFKYSESDLNKIFENMNNVSRTMYMNVDRAVEYIIKMDSLIYKKFLIKIAASSYEHYSILESLNSLYNSTALTHFEAIEIIEKCNIDVNKIYFLKQKKKIPFFHYAYDNFNNIFYNALFENYGKEYNEKNENFESLEEYINKKLLNKENTNKKSNRKDSVEKIKFYKEVKNNSKFQEIDESIVNEIKRINNVRLNNNLLIFISSDYYLKIDLNNEIEIHFENKNNIIYLKNILGKYILQLKEKDYQRIKSVILNQESVPEIKIETQ